MTIEKNMLRKRANKLPTVTDEMWEKVHEENQKIVQDYFDNNARLSDRTAKQYKSAMRQFFWWVYQKAGNKPVFKINKRDFNMYKSYLLRHGLSSGSIDFKQYAISSLCNHIDLMVIDYDPQYATFRNFTKNLPPLPKNTVYEKIPISKEEYKKLMDTLQKEEDYLAMAWVATAFNCGGRRSELIQFKTEILSYPFKKGKDGKELNYIETKPVRGKGAGNDGKPLRYMINKEALHYMQLWVDQRGYEHEYIFTTKYNGEYKRVSPNWANYLCSQKLSRILGRRINPHLFKATCITHKLEEGKSLEVVSKYIGHHAGTEVTKKHYDLRSDEEEKDLLF